ncbi:hypothetical protein F66182_298 [Fusarium sp. NRRL 66182]|nr:hypothetical protein F66182_298 [Fusarium sp. NRRL 66182]
MSPALRLPALRVVAKQANLEITAKPSLTIDLPDDAQSISTIDHVLSAVQDSHLWIIRTGACCIEVSVAVDGRPVLEHSRLKGIIEAISSCEVWGRLGVRLEYNRSCAAQLPGLLSFSLQHPDLSSALVAPVSAWTTPFRTLLLAIDVNKLTKRQEAPTKSTGTRKRQKRASKPRATARPRSEERCLLETLEPADQQAIETFISSLNCPLNSNQSDTLRIQSKNDVAPRVELLEELHSSSAIEILIEQLTLAPEKKYRGYHVWGGGSKYCLAKLAPGVFHTPYLKCIADRAQLLPVIATSLASMKYAESPALRQKVVDLQPGVGMSGHARDEEEDFINSIEKRTWEVLLANTQMPRSADKRRGKRLRPALVPQDFNPEVIIAHAEQNDTATEECLPDQSVYIKEENREIAAMDVSWDALCSFSGMTEHETSMALNLDPVAVDQYPWAGLALHPISLEAPQQNFARKDWMGNDFDMTQQDNEMSPAQGCYYTACIGQGANMSIGEDMVDDPASFQTLDQWLICSNGM